MKMILTKREKIVIDLILEDFSTKEIAIKLDKSIETITTQRKRIIKKTNSKSMFGAIKNIMNQKQVVNGLQVYLAGF